MAKSKQHKLPDEKAIPLGPKFVPALEQLAVARDYACDVNRDIWEFAVEIGSLMELGLSTSDLRWLVSKGYVEHAGEVTRRHDTARNFKRGHNLAFRGATCFVLTETGADFRTHEDAVAVPDEPACGGDMLTRHSVLLFPHWDAARRVLCIGPHVVKRFRFSAPNQESVLAAFQEEGWPPAVYDPLPGSGKLDAKQRLHDTIKFLNRNQENQFITFRGDGNGERILWEPAQDAVAAAGQVRQVARFAA